jgi:ATP-dependent helicase HrpB
MQFDFPLPIDEALPSLLSTLATHVNAVLVAPPGAGKTTRVPLALLNQSWLKNQKILVLEPRRLAARGAATRMAATLGEKLGNTVGMRARLNSNIGPNTRIEVITEGVFTRMILADPTLTGIGAVLFDEFHERSLDADLGLALALDAQGGLRENLRILVMSATLDGARVAKLMNNAPIIESQGRSFPVETRYLGRNPNIKIEDQIIAAIRTAHRADTGSMLVFLPGAGEIRRVERMLQETPLPNTIIAPLFGAMDQQAQDYAILPSAPNIRKIVLATSIAESSLTIEGVRVVIDSGLSRVPRFEPDMGITRLETVRVNRASADQRRGRAGRTEPGICYRLWEEASTQSLPAFAEPEIKAADLSGLLLDCAEWGVSDPNTLSWLDPPPIPALNEAKSELICINALDNDGRITALGKNIRSLPLPPRLARMVLEAASMGATQDATHIAALIVERGLGGNSIDITHRLEHFQRDRSPRAMDMKKLCASWAKMALSSLPSLPSPHIDRIYSINTSINANIGYTQYLLGEGVPKGRMRGMKMIGIYPSSDLTSLAHLLPQGEKENSPAALIALTYPERIAKARGNNGQFLLSNGRGVQLDPTDALAKQPFLVIAEMSGKAANTRILLAAPLSEQEMLEIASDRITTTHEISFDVPSRSLRARYTQKLGAITLKSEPRSVPKSPETAYALAKGASSIGVSYLPWTKAHIQWRDRVAFLRANEPDIWPDTSNEALANTITEWLVQHLSDETSLEEISPTILGNALHGLLNYVLTKRLENEAPTHFLAPTGMRHAINYESEDAPILAIRVQELFGLNVHPSIAKGKLLLTLHLLSPKQKPIQITRDLVGFWQGSWAAVKSDMKGQYPRHPWPDYPANAVPTTRAKPRGT